MALLVYYNGKTIHTFTGSGIFETTSEWTSTNVEYVVIGGGGGGGLNLVHRTMTVVAVVALVFIILEQHQLEHIQYQLLFKLVLVVLEGTNSDDGTPSYFGTPSFAPGGGGGGFGSTKWK